MLCGTQVCENGQVCCYKKAPPLAFCIDPVNFESNGCEKMDIPCFTPKECPIGTNCCVTAASDNSLSVGCRQQTMCPGDGVMTYIACGSDMDCPATSPSCNLLTQVMGKDFSICYPGP
jgi:hypothetical protein